MLYVKPPTTAELRALRIAKGLWYEGVLGIGGAISYVYTAEASALAYLILNGCWSLMMELLLNSLGDPEDGPVDKDGDDDDDDDDGNGGGPGDLAMQS